MAIRNVVVGRLVEGAGDGERRQLRRGIEGILGLQLTGMLANEAGPDAGLRAGGWSFAIINDWIDDDAYRAYDADAEHLRFRTMIGEVCAEIARVQFELTP